MNQLSVNSLYCQYDSQSVLKDLSLDLAENEIIALLGPSGCGKTTLLKAIAGLQPISSGEIFISQKQVSGENITIPSERRNIGMIFQDYALFPHLTAEENVAFGLKQGDKTSKAQRAIEMLTLVGLADFAKRYPHELSGGQQQRVAIARALAYQPALILLDEPFSNIDNQSREKLMPEIRNILKQQKVSGLLVTHNKDEAFAFADKIAVFQQGQLAQLGTAEELYYGPQSKYVADFIGKASYLPILKASSSSIETALGTIEIAAGQLATPETAMVMVRPEQVSIKADPNGAYQVQDKAFCGHYWRYTVQSSQDESGILLSYSNENIPDESKVSIELSGPNPAIIKK
ncbi:ABC transporter ATP-binding protein [Aliikangiella marina]|uniref:ABC transporter ATP-binding protein n=1 Tax=Aliikangiella marina TaxID=1712262 RepID=A0A545TDH0_9GAMM|nr:ABC transporter ATP-binding protein [Aliikangiella marina]TQV75216.1 ABC transporter ATP-binding protein [Aliikangiella marina]